MTAWRSRWCVLGAVWLCTAPAQAQDVDVDFSGRLFTELIAYPCAHGGCGEGDPDTDRMWLSGLGFEASFVARPASWLQLRFDPHFYVDLWHPDRNRVVPLEARATFVAGPVDIDLGLRRFSWGNGLLHRPTDRLNQTDWGTGFFRSGKLSDLALVVRANLDPVVVEMVWEPVYRYPFFPGGDDPVGVRFGGLGALKLDTRRDFEVAAIQARNMTFAARVNATLGPVVLEAMWSSGPSKLPGPLLDDLTLRDHIYPEDVVGGSVAWTVGPVVMRGELAWTFTERAELLVAAANPYPWTEPVPDSYGAYVVGVEVTFWDVFANADLVWVTEYLGEVRQFLDAQAVFRPFQNDVFSTLRLSLDDDDDTRFELGAVVDLGRGDTLIRASAQRHLGADFVLRLDANILVAGSGDGPLAILHELTRRDSVAANFSWHF